MEVSKMTMQEFIEYFNRNKKNLDEHGLDEFVDYFWKRFSNAKV